RTTIAIAIRNGTERLGIAFPYSARIVLPQEFTQPCAVTVPTQLGQPAAGNPRARPRELWPQPGPGRWPPLARSPLPPARGPREKAPPLPRPRCQPTRRPQALPSVGGPSKPVLPGTQ